MSSSFEKLSTGEKIFNIFNNILMWVVLISTLYPIIYVIFASFSNPALLLSNKGLLLKPLGFSLSSYKKVFEYPLILTGYRNTLFIVIVGVTLNIFLTSIAAYVLSRKSFYFRNIIMFFITFTMFFSGGIIPFYFTVKSLKLYNTIFALIVPVAINTFNLIIMRTAFAAIPEELEEAARIDGADHFFILFRVAMPLVKPVLAVILLYYTVGHWNSWFNAMMLLRDRDLYPLQLVLREILIVGKTSELTVSVDIQDLEALSETIKYSAIVVSTVPVLILYPFLQKYFVEGIMIGAIKG